MKLLNLPPETYSIGIYTGTTPFSLSPAVNANNPVLSRKTFPLHEVNFVADPFLFFANQKWHLFFEVLPMGSRRGKIAYSTSLDAMEWTYPKTVLEEPFHLSYPYIFRFEGQIYMVPETFESNSVRLYRANPFPQKWTYVKDLLTSSCVDSSIFEYNGKWWMYTCSRPKKHDTLLLYFADTPLGPWHLHPANPIKNEDSSSSRPAGRVLVWNDKVYRFCQDCGPFYGAKVRAFEIEILTITTYQEKELPESPILEGTGSGWNKLSMHHIDVQRIDEQNWIAAVDGRFE